MFDPPKNFTCVPDAAAAAELERARDAVLKHSKALYEDEFLHQGNYTRYKPSPRGCSVDGSRRRRGCDVDIPRRRVAAAPRIRRGYSVVASRRRAYDVDIPW